MPDETRCPSCGCEWTGRAPDGLCPRCLMQNALGTASVSEEEPRKPSELKVILREALDREPGPPRAAYLDGACRGDAALRDRAEQLLSDLDRSGRFPGSSGGSVTAPPGATRGEPGGGWPEPGPNPTRADAVGPTVDQPGRWHTERPGDRIGQFKLLQEIGEGGMGTVFMAEQERPVRRRVALKVIKAGLDTGQVVARFEAERQALALMDHPNIARVLDAGATEAGRPYFVMELVKGIPITQYCDEARLSPIERLELFIPVCQAIQHAHQKGIIHRDVKPSNVLVTLIDGRPVPRIIDFGIAKATNQRLTERTMFTQFGAFVGTPEYMSPEQADISGMDVDTRSDVYSLGVLLYELLTGSTPLDRESLSKAAFAEVLRRIKEEEPPKPSTRLSASGDRLASLSAVRRTGPRNLTRAVRGDLDWIVMRALEKDRTRRYETAAGFANDVRRYLDGEPVEAGPPSASYRLRKLARKHRTALATAGSFALLLIAATAVSAALAVVAIRSKRTALEAEARARADRDLAVIAEARTGRALEEIKAAKATTDAALSDTKRAKEQAEAVLEYLVDAFRRPDPSLDGRELKVVDLLDRATAKLDVEFTGSSRSKGALLDALGRTYTGLGLPAKSVDVHLRAVGALEAALGPDHRDALSGRSNLALAYLYAGRAAEAIPLLERVLRQSAAALGVSTPDTLKARTNLASAYVDAGRVAEAIPLHEEVFRQRMMTLGPDHPDTLTVRNNLSIAYLHAGRVAEAIPLLEETLRRRTAALGPHHPETLSSRNNLGGAYLDAGRWTDAIPLLETVLEQATATLGPDHPHTQMVQYNLGGAYRHAGRAVDAIPLLEGTVRRLTEKFGLDHPRTLTTRNELAETYLEAGRAAEGVKLHEDTQNLFRARLGSDHRQTLISRNNLAQAYLFDGRTAEGIALHEDTLARFRATLGPNHPDTVVTRNNLAKAYQAARQFARAEPLFCEGLTQARLQFGPDDPQTAGAMAWLARCLLEQKKWAEAEVVLRECLAIREKLAPDDWTRFNTMSLLGAALLGRRCYPEAEPLIVGGYEGVKARAAKVPSSSKPFVAVAAARVLRLYEAWGRHDEAARWRAKLRGPTTPSRDGTSTGELPANPFVR